ncbi:DMT family transporter [Paenibacillus mesophilus]|uniref:DMT family transporter n=1 Tax=Paenibacillus mesophilus TaxID=2582849 RepID=UPI00110E9B56|nr:DMT family transporter [Paenibacillus mesophilus]TMV47748.1 DMT family transporter [Paenibacillus mesophilus]
MTANRNSTAYAAVVLYAFVIGFSFIFVKFALTAASPLDTLAHRFTISLIAAAVPVCCGWIRLRIRPRRLLTVLPLALFYPVLFFTLQTFGLSYTSSSEAGIVQAIVPAFTMIMAVILLKERPGTWQKLSVLLSIAGVVYLFVMKGTRFEAASIAGIALMALAALSLAGYGVLARKMAQSLPVTDMTFMMSLIGFIAFNAMSLARHVSEGTLSTYFEPFGSPLFAMSIVYLGVMSSLISSFLSNYALSRLEAYKVSAFNNLATLITVMAGVFVLKERLEVYHIVGAVLIVAGVLGTNLLGTGKRGVKAPERKDTVREGRAG